MPLFYWIMTISPALLHQLERHYDHSFEGEWTQLTGGYECDVWRVSSDVADYVVRICPAWRSDAELQWTYDFVTICAQHIPQVVAPIQTREGTHFIKHDDRAVLVFPYINGTPLDRGNDSLIRHSAELLAKIHLISQDLPTLTKRPPSHPSAPKDVPNQSDPDYIQDPQLDGWYKDFIEQSNPQMGIMHGDYYRANILCQSDQVVGIVDWDECNTVPILAEVAWATWEQCHTESGDTLDMDKTKLFLQSYREVNDSIPSEAFHALIPLIRHHLRFEIRRSLAMEEAGESWDNDYRLQEIQAFANLRDMTRF